MTKFRPVGRDDPSLADREIARLEDENAKLRDRVSYLESKLASQAAGSTNMVREVIPRVELPTQNEMKQLFQIVSAKWPATIASKNSDEAFVTFSAALRYLCANVSHSDKRSKYAMSSWIDRAEFFLRSVGIQTDVKPGAIAAAAAALGYQHSSLDGSPTGWDFWFSEGQHNLPGPKQWRGLLKGAPLKPAIDEAQKAWDRLHRGRRSAEVTTQSDALGVMNSW